MERIIYFAYGSNMDLEQMKFRCRGGYEVLGIGKMQNWKIFINNRGYANISPQEESIVYGLMFNINSESLRLLDRYEGFPYLYTRKQLPTFFADDILKPLVYIDENNLEIGHPQTGYLERVVESAKRFSFPETYINYLESFK